MTTADEIISGMQKRLAHFSGESRRSYQKALASFSNFCLENGLSGLPMQMNMLADWIVTNRLHGLSHNTSSFYFDKLRSLYKAGNSKKGDPEILNYFKEIRIRLNEGDFQKDYPSILAAYISQIKKSGQAINLDEEAGESNPAIVALALYAGILPSVIRSYVNIIPDFFDILKLCDITELTEAQKEEILQSVKSAAKGENDDWYAMRLRPGYKFNDLLAYLSRLPAGIKMPGIFYPCEEIAMRMGRKIIWKGRPYIRDVVFFKYKFEEIYNLMSKIWEIAWCYKNAGSGSYARIPAQAMEDFRKAIGLLGPAFEIEAAGEMELREGDEVVIINGDFADRHARILRGEKHSEDQYHKIYRVMLLDTHGNWNVGIDARLLRKI